MQEDERHELEGTTSYEAVMAADDWQKTQELFQFRNGVSSKAKSPEGLRFSKEVYVLLGR